MAKKSWAWQTELNPYTQRTLRILAKRVFLQRIQFILRSQSQENQRTKLNKKKKHSALNTFYPRVCHTKKAYYFMAKKSWAWTTELNSYAQITLRFLDERVFLQTLKFILRSQCQENHRTKLNKKKKHSALNTFYLRVCQTKNNIILWPRNLEREQLSWTRIHREL